MRNAILLLISLWWLLLSSSGFAAAEITQPLPDISWQTYSNTPFDEAKQKQQFIFLYIKSPSCHWCQQMDKTTMQTPSIIQLIQTHFIPVLVSVDTQTDIAAKYQITSLPSILILDADNHIIHIFRGYFPPDYIENYLKQILANPAKPSPGNETIQQNIPDTAATTSMLSNEAREQLKKKQLDETTSSQNLTPSDLEYVLTLNNEKIVSATLNKLLSSPSQKQTSALAQDLKNYSQAYIYSQDPAYLAAARKIVEYVKQSLTSPDGIFYAEQGSTKIYSYENGMMINALAYFYMASGDSTALQEALKAVPWMINNLSIPGGGYRHEKTENTIINLNDTLAMGEAFLTLYKVTQTSEFLNRAVLAAEFINKYFINPENNIGFVTKIDLTSTSNSGLVINANENADIVRFTGLLFSYTGNKAIQQIQLNAFHYLINPTVVQNNSPAMILLADQRVTNYPLHITIVGAKQDIAAKNLFLTALTHAPFDTRLDWWDQKEGPLLNTDTEYQVMDKPVAYICHGFQCSFPLYNASELISAIHQIIVPEHTATPPLQVTSTNNQDSAEKILTDDNWFIVIVAFIGFGLLISFTPCILPLVPIMASIIVGNTIGVRKEKTFLLCLAYVIAMAVTYSLLGLLAGKFGVYLQIYMQTTLIISLFSTIFLLLGFCMLGAYELTLPKVIQQKVSAWSNLQKGGTFAGVIIMGILSTLIISPCVSAPLIGVLSFITKSGDYLLGAIGLFFMGIGMGLPLLIITVFSKNILPKASRWNNQIKHFFGLILLGAAIWLASRVISEAVSMLLWSALIILTTLYMGLTSRRIKGLFNKLWKTLTIMVFLYGVAVFFNALFISSELYPLLKQIPGIFSQQGTASHPPLFKNINNLTELKKALEEAKATPVMLDFTAKWCSACVRLEHDVLSNPEIYPQMQKFILLRVDLTNTDNDNMAIARKFQVLGPPSILFFDKHQQLLNLRVNGDVNVEKFKTDMQQALNPAENNGYCAN